MRILECSTCFSDYDFETSTAKNAVLYCSQECQEQDEAYIAEGNKQVDEALAANPKALGMGQLKESVTLAPSLSQLSLLFSSLSSEKAEEQEKEEKE